MKKITQINILLLIVIIILNGCNSQNNNNTLSYLTESNLIMKDNINVTISNLKNCSNNKYYLDYVNLYVANIDSIINLIKTDRLENANGLLNSLKKKVEFKANRFNNFELLKNSSSLSKEISINRLLNIESSLVNEFYSMKVRSNFEIAKIKLFPIVDKNSKGDAYKAKLVLIGNTEKRYTVIVDNDTLKNYSEDNFPIYTDPSSKKGLITKKAILIIDKWGLKSKFPFEFNYFVK
ncbi:MAG TPA: hypothetical protein VNG53_06070 [Bacteroidia bacterium]|nr:hypothetical protein [Bacteroidia bacterium]